MERHDMTKSAFHFSIYCFACHRDQTGVLCYSDQEPLRHSLDKGHTPLKKRNTHLTKLYTLVERRGMKKAAGRKAADVKNSLISAGYSG